MAEKTIVLITGANTGLGYQIIRALCASDQAYEILVGGRSLAKAEEAAKAVLKEHSSTKSTASAIQVDIENDDSISAALSHVESKYGRLDALVNNAGAQFDPQITSSKLTMRQAWSKSWDVNVVGTQVMTAAFVPLLLNSKNPRLLFITSGTSTLAGTENPKLPINALPGKGWPKTGLTNVSNVPSYRSAKTGMNMMMREWHRLLTPDGVKVWCISPGFLATGLGGDQEKNKQSGAGDPSAGGDFVKTVLEGERDNDVGKIVNKGGLQPW